MSVEYLNLLTELKAENQELKAKLRDSKIVCDVCGVDHLGCLVLCPSCASKEEVELKAKLDELETTLRCPHCGKKYFFEDGMEAKR